MRHYEIVLLVHPGQSEQVPAMLERYQEMVTAGTGRVHRVEDWGRRRLAYMINEVYKAHYIMLNVECELDTLRELERNFKFNDSIVRSLVIRRPRAITEQSSLARAKAEEDRVEAEKQAAQAKAAAEQAARQKSAEAATEPATEPAAEAADEDKRQGADAAEQAPTETAQEAAQEVAQEAAADREVTPDAAEAADSAQPKPQPETV